jgi:hypothetical protein
VIGERSMGRGSEAICLVESGGVGWRQPGPVDYRQSLVNVVKH